jgi:septum formation protein
MARQISDHHPLLLGSGSPRRRQILSDLRIPFVVRVARIDESVRSGEHADDYVVRVAAEKADNLTRYLEEDHVAALLVADTTVVLDEEVLGKPADSEEAERMVMRLVGRYHEVLTRFEVRSLDSSQNVAETVRSRVYMRDADAGDLRRYAATGEGLDKAGAYAVQGCGAFLIERIEGSYSNVIGLPASELVLALQSIGLLGAFPLASGN